jgi:hypothetical protein
MYLNKKNICGQSGVTQIYHLRDQAFGDNDKACLITQLILDILFVKYRQGILLLQVLSMNI